eukprot:scpid28687/ scgid11527/ Alanine--tRNA ligase, cytoplasmic; Alanyl-tRNA synthetase
MNQFKPLFQGTVDPKSDMAKYRRVVNSQKCIRAGGKHNDLDDVGKDTYHHTFFEMLGNWSFGDFFKKEAIEWAWSLLVDVYKLPKERMYVTYFEGGNGVPVDDEVRQIWLDLGLPEDRVLPFGMKDNFWEMGDTGPCGPCTEIHFDRIGGRNAAHLVNMDDPEVLEIWNLVFTQFNREDDGSLRPLPKKNCDTGMGLERIASVIQGKMSNYDTDLFMPIFDAVQKITGTRPYSGLVGEADTDGIDMAYRVLADHVRTLVIALSDGGRPDSVDRGYVLRRILRRGVRYAADKLNAPPGTFASLVPIVCESLGEFFPEVMRDPQTIMDIINEEETQFLKTLSHGRRMFNRSVASVDGGVIPGNVAFRLYDTYGFPIDLTRLMAQERGLAIDEEGFQKAKKDNQELSRANQKGAAEAVVLDVHAVAELAQSGIQATDDSLKYNYRGDDNGNYTFEGCIAEIKALRCNKSFVEEITPGQEASIILDQTCFYAEQGGQQFDAGFITKTDDEDCEFVVANTQVVNGYVSHIGKMEGTLKVGDKVRLAIDEKRRRRLMNNHTATHLLNYGLRQVLGDADQKGSSVAPDRLRFDFTAKKAMTPDQLKQCEKIVQEMIATKKGVFAKESPLDQAKEIQGLRAVFGEVYPNPVRVVSVGIEVEQLLSDPSSPAGSVTSIEFCGGTHLHGIGHMDAFAIVTEEAIAKGIRRIVAVTSKEAHGAISRGQMLEKKVEDLCGEIAGKKNDPDFNYLAYSKKINELKDALSEQVIQTWLKDELRSKLQVSKKITVDAERAVAKKNAAMVIEAIKEKLPEANGKLLVVLVPFTGDAVSEGVKYARKDAAAPNTMVIGVSDGNVTCSCFVNKAGISQGLKASEWVNELQGTVGGKCGGSPQTAMINGASTSDANAVVELAQRFAEQKLTA